jgi:hypothetical protein
MFAAQCNIVVTIIRNVLELKKQQIYHEYAPGVVEHFVIQLQLLNLSQK